MNNNSNGMGITTIIFLVFLVLKLTKTGPVANWSWWWVTCPLWIPLVLTTAVLAFMFCVAVIAVIFKSIIN